VQNNKGSTGPCYTFNAGWCRDLRPRGSSFRPAILGTCGSPGPAGFSTHLDSDSFTIVPYPARRPLIISESHLSGSRGPRPSGTGSCRDWEFYPTGVIDPVTMVLPEVRITKPRGRPLTAGAHGI
jgi:hypothetical protein